MGREGEVEKANEKEREKERERERGRERERDTDKCILFMCRLGSNPRYLVTSHTVLKLKH